MALNAPVLLWLMRGWDGFLERDRDRAVFDLAPKPQFLNSTLWKMIRTARSSLAGELPCLKNHAENFFHM